MKKETKVIKDKKQTRTTIPKKFVDELNITNKDKVEWSMDKMKKALKGELKRK